MSDTDQKKLERILMERSVRHGNFILASGKSSTVYVDVRLTTMSPEGMALIGSLALDRILSLEWNPDSVGGLTLGADPVAFAVSFSSANSPRPIRCFTVRKEAKSHGTGNLIEGPFLSGDRVVVVEDVITTGKSALQAIESIEQAGGQIQGVLAIVDREDGGREKIESRGFAVTALTTIANLVSPAV